MKMRVLVSVGALACAALFTTACTSSPKAAPSWDDFWRDRGVSPAPPRNFLEGLSEPPEIQNLTNGALSDEVVRRWVIGALRRNAGEIWTTLNLRLDVAKSGVLGSPGLNGTDGAIERERAKGAVEIRCDQPNPVIVAAGVIAVPWKVRQRFRGAHLTEYVIVQVFRTVAGVCNRVLVNGRTEVFDWSVAESGDLLWQLDTGEFREDPVLGDLWYQAHGWTCTRSNPIYEVCGRVQPDRTRN